MLTVLIVVYLVVGLSIAGLMIPVFRTGIPGWAASGPDDPVGQQMDRDAERRFEWIRFELDVRNPRTVLRFGLFLFFIAVAWPVAIVMSWRVQRRYTRRWGRAAE